jgi:transmembrane 9 superfamily member 3
MSLRYSIARLSSLWLTVSIPSQYEPNEEVVVWMNTIGPMNNWQETYDYYQLPFCHGDSPVQHHHETLGEALQGMDLINSGIPMSYLGKLNSIVMQFMSN